MAVIVETDFFFIYELIAMKQRLNVRYENRIQTV